MPDEEWIAFAAKSGFAAISHDRNIRSDRVAVQAVMENGLRLFIMRGKGLTALEMAKVFVGALPKVYQILEEQPAAFIGVVRRTSAARGILKLDAEVRLTFEEWMRGKRPPVVESEDDLPL